MKCNQVNCKLDAIFVVYWPGKSPPPVMCDTHARQAIGVAEAIGLTLHIDPIYNDESEPYD